MSRKPRVAVGWRVKNTQRGEKSVKSYTLAWNLIKYLTEKCRFSDVY